MRWRANPLFFLSFCVSELWKNVGRRNIKKLKRMLFLTTKHSMHECLGKAPFSRYKAMLNLFATRCDHSHNGCCLPWQRVANEVTWCMVVWCTQNLRRDGCSFMWHQPCQRLSTPLRWIFKKRAIKS